jgi:hypothetical protein
MWKAVTVPQSMSVYALRASTKGNWELPVAKMTRAEPCRAMASLTIVAVFAAAA